jgi:hypothetical protein
MRSNDGKVLADLPFGVRANATQFEDGYTLANCREGTLTMARETAPDEFKVVQTLQT